MAHAMISWYDRQGEPIDFFEWAAMQEDPDYVRVAWDELPNGVSVSTVWLGYDLRDGPPLIFETAVFHSHRNFIDTSRKYSTEQEALEGHNRLVEAFRRKH